MAAPARLAPGRGVSDRRTRDGSAHDRSRSGGTADFRNRCRRSDPWGARRRAAADPARQNGHEVWSCAGPTSPPPPQSMVSNASISSIPAARCGRRTASTTSTRSGRSPQPVSSPVGSTSGSSAAARLCRPNVSALQRQGAGSYGRGKEPAPKRMRCAARRPRGVRSAAKALEAATGVRTWARPFRSSSRPRKRARRVLPS